MDLSPFLHLYLVRHGATAANERRPYTLQGRRSDLPLSPLGQRQAARTAQYLAGLPIQHVYSSPLVRAVQTAAAIADVHQLSVQTLPELAECDVGHWEGWDWATIARRFPRQHANFVRNAARYPYLGGETLADVRKRTRPVFQQIMRGDPGRHIVVVGHAVVNRVFLAGLLGIPLRLARTVPQDTGCINVIHSKRGMAHVAALNSVHHLEPAAA